MTDLDLDAIEARADAATDGPWVVKHEPAWEADNVQHPDVITVGAQMWEGDDEPMTVCLVSTDYEDDPVDVLLDAEFIAHARTDVPALVAALREARADCETHHTTVVHQCCEDAQAVPSLRAALATVTAERDEARADAEAAKAALAASEQWDMRVERDDWRRRYEALRDGVTGLCDVPIAAKIPRRWVAVSDLRAVVARVEGDES